MLAKDQGLRPLGLIFVAVLLSSVSSAATVTCTVVDDVTDLPLAARVYIKSETGQYFTAESEKGVAIPYERRVSSRSYEIHTTVSAHPFSVELPAGDYMLTVEKGKEYLPATRRIRIAEESKESLEFRLVRWVDMSRRGWFSGETHVHRDVNELAVLQLAEDINVAFPLTAWVTDSLEAPVSHNKNRTTVPPAKLVRIDASHVFWPVNTEYEIFSVRRQRHTLGAVFILNHKQQFALSAPPVTPIAAEARRQGGFLELDKHNWPWSMMLVPQMKVDLFELANNHMWRTAFRYADWYPEYVADYMQIEMDGKFTERGWIDFGFQNYYALLNCGFRMKPTAGSASGVHPVPFGFGRVYVKLDDTFSYEKWVQALLAGNSFVTTGPMLMSNTVRTSETKIRSQGELRSATRPLSLEVIVNGLVVRRIKLDASRTPAGAFQVPFDVEIELSGSSWVALRAFAEQPNEQERVVFAHTAPVHFEVEDRPLRPTRFERDYLVSRVQNEIARNRNVISADAMQEFEEALARFRDIQVAE